MRKIIAAEYVTLDGVMEAPAWTAPFWNDEIAQMQHALLFASDALVLGRNTYEGFAQAWPTMEGTGDFGERMNALPKHVASTTLAEMTWNATRLAGDVPQAIAALKQEPGQVMLIYGSATLVQTLLQHRLVDELRLMMHPVVLGRGKRLFPEGGVPATLALADVQTTATGVAVLTYRPVAQDAAGETPAPA